VPQTHSAHACSASLSAAPRAGSHLGRRTAGCSEAAGAAGSGSAWSAASTVELRHLGELRLQTQVLQSCQQLSLRDAPGDTQFPEELGWICEELCHALPVFAEQPPQLRRDLLGCQRPYLRRGLLGSLRPLRA
jgi:hypothetical protein